MESKAARQYFSRVRRRLICPSASRDQLLGRGRRMMAQFDEENPDAQYSDFVSAFGTPKDFVEQMLSCVDSEAVNAVQRRYRYIKHTAVIALALVLAAGGVFGCLQMVKYGKYQEIFNDIKDANIVIVQHGPYEISNEEARITFKEANIPFPGDGG